MSSTPKPNNMSSGRESLFNPNFPAASDSLLARSGAGSTPTGPAAGTPGAGATAGTTMAGPGAGAQDEDVKPAVKPESISITVKDQHNTCVFKMRRDRELEKLMVAASKHFGKNMSDCRWLFDGERIHATDTPASLEMVQDDIIEIVTEQIGGSPLVIFA